MFDINLSAACQDMTPAASALAIPPLISKAGPAAAFAWEELLLGSIRNPHTRIAYGRAVWRLLDWLEARSIPLPAVTPGIIGGYFDEVPGSVPTKKLALAAIRRLMSSSASSGEA